MPQVTTRLSTETRNAFDLYASSVGLKASELARILIIRELRRRQILPTTKRDTGSQPKLPGRKLTAHFHSADIVDELDRYSSSYGHNRSDAAKYIFEQELKEKWLLKAFA
jgi:hypothetical protein